MRAGFWSGVIVGVIGVSVYHYVRTKKAPGT